MSAPSGPVGLSVWEQALYDHIVNHVESEAAVLDEYVALAASERGHVRYLLELIGEDEARHHRLYGQWAETIRDIGRLEPGPIPEVARERDPHALLDAVDRLLAVERDDERDLHRLRKDLKEVQDTTLWALLVDLMRADTEKHIHILEFLRHHIRETLKRES